jgi:predicted TIM-barrel fold metal-dependent hydrolase
MTSQSISKRIDTPILDPGCQIQEELGEILPYLPDDKAVTKFMEYARSRGPGAPRANVYSGPSAFPLSQYKKANGGEEPTLKSSPLEAIGADELEEKRLAYGIEQCIVNPTVNLGLSEVNNDRYAVAIAKGYNDWLLDQLNGYDSLMGNVIVAPQEPGRAADEIDRVATEQSVVGVHLPCTGLTPLPGHRSYVPIYEAAANHGLPVTMQPTIGLKSYHQQYYSTQWFAEDYTYHPSFNHMQNITSLLFEGIPERFPSLYFVLQGAGIGFAPYLIHRLDDHFLELGYEIPALDKLPSKYLDEQFYWGTAPIGDTFSDGEYHSRMIRILGVDNVLYTSDLPHELGDSPAEIYDRIEDEFTMEQLDRIFGENARELFGI